MAKKGISILVDHLSLLVGEPISIVYNLEIGAPLRWTVWKGERGTASPEGQIGSGMTLLEAIQSAFKNTVRDMFSEEV